MMRVFYKIREELVVTDDNISDGGRTWSFQSPKRPSSGVSARRTSGDSKAKELIRSKYGFRKLVETPVRQCFDLRGQCYGYV